MSVFELQRKNINETESFNYMHIPESSIYVKSENSNTKYLREVKHGKIAIQWCQALLYDTICTFL